MIKQIAFRRKIVYLVIMVLLLGVLSVLGRPSTREADPKHGSRGGTLAKLRQEHGFSQAQLGEIDPASETIRLATLGLRGVATNILWEKANRYKMKKDWAKLSATLQQMTKLQPNFISVWQFQAWNLAYNVSREFEDFRQRYHWVIRGILFLKKGIRYNQSEPRLLRDTGWFISQKIGRSDERKQFRVLFREDDDFHGSRPLAERDNWLVGWLWFDLAEKLIAGGVSLGEINPGIFYSHKPMNVSSYAENLETDGVFFPRAKEAWKNFEAEWHDFGDVDIRTATAGVIRLNEMERLLAEIDEARAALDALQPGLRQELIAQQMQELTDEQRAGYDAWKADPFAATDDQLGRAADAKVRLDQVDDKAVAAAITGENRREAQRLLKQINVTTYTATIISRYRAPVRYEHWRRRAQMEQLPELVGYEDARGVRHPGARELIYLGQQAVGDLPAQRDYYNRGSALWREALEICQQKYEQEPPFEEIPLLIPTPRLVANDTYVEEVKDVVVEHMRILEQLDERFPEDYPLADFVRARSDDMAASRVARLAVRRANACLAGTLHPAELAADDQVKEDGEEDEEQTSPPAPLKPLPPATPLQRAQAARAAYDKALKKWQEVLHECPSLALMSDRATGEELLGVISDYGKVLRRLDETYPDQFLLHDFLHSQIKHAPETRAAEELARRTQDARKRADFPAALQSSSDTLAAWRDVTDRFPSLLARSDRTIDKKIVRAISTHADTLTKVDEPSPKTPSPRPFVLQDFLHAQIIQTGEFRDAQQSFARATQLFEQNPSAARRQFDKALTAWIRLLNNHKIHPMALLFDPPVVEKLAALVDSFGSHYQQPESSPEFRSLTEIVQQYRGTGPSSP